MPKPEATLARPRRWDEPFCPEMNDAAVKRLLSVAPFCDISPDAFPPTLPLHGLFRNDARIVQYQTGDLILREGDYGSSAFMLLHGQARVALERIDVLSKERSVGFGQRLLRAVTQAVGSSRTPEVRSCPSTASIESDEIGAREEGNRTAIFLQDVPRILDETRTARLGPGEVFGELAALTRSQRTATVFAESDVVALEMRWQGLRDLMRFDPTLREHIDRLYRKNSLRVHLRETPLFSELDADALETIGAATQFETHGELEWRADLSGPGDDLFERISREPLVVEEGTHPAGLYLVRSGFARMSRRRGAGHQTVAYLGKGSLFGAEELAHTHLTGAPTPMAHSLRAIGYLDLLRVPVEVTRRVVLPAVSRETIESLARPLGHVPVGEAKNEAALSARTLDFLVDRRLMNGVQAMIVNLDRCTRCDDCLRACAATHDGNPRFVRQGPIHNHHQFANACMHCVDPVCMIGCPTGAIHRDPATGVVRIDDPTCVGCSTCAESCPYHNIKMVETRTHKGAIALDENGEPLVKATKCDLCVDSLTGPACLNACPHDALARVDVSQITPLANWMA